MPKVQYLTWCESTHDTGWLAPFRQHFRRTSHRRAYVIHTNTQGIRTISVDWNDANLDGTFAAGERTGSIEYLIDNSNFTGYQQTILDKLFTASGGSNPTVSKRIGYTFGTDEITQTVSLIDSGSQLITQSSTLTYGHDGRGSVQVLFDAAAAIAQVYTYSAYGELLAIHNGSAAVVGTIGQANLESLASTNKLYNGEGFDTRTGLYNFRARNYSASLGRFERLDPFDGNPTDPFSFNKYGFVHGNPVMGVDPTGLFTQFFGYSTERVISEDYRSDFPTNNVSTGAWSRIGNPGNSLYRAKPDILDHTFSTYMEIKPLSVSGILSATAQMIQRSIQFAGSGYSPDSSWRSKPTIGTMRDGTAIVYMNVFGVVFYTDILDAFEDYIAIRALGWAGVWSYMAKAGGSIFTSFGNTISTLTGIRVGGDSGRLRGQVGLALILRI